jgi:hypothetical protein
LTTADGKQRRTGLLGSADHAMALLRRRIVAVSPRPSAIGPRQSLNRCKSISLCLK